MRYPVQGDAQAVSSQYLGWLIREQIDRARLLRGAIPDSPRHAALEQLARLCRVSLEEQARQLGQARALLDGTGDADASTVLTTVKRCTRVVGAIEGYGMPPLHCPSDRAVFLNDVLSAMHREMDLSMPCPAVSCMSNDYYFAHPSTWTIHVPLSEAEFLLHLPDFYHESGHLLLVHLNFDAKYE